MYKQQTERKAGALCVLRTVFIHRDCVSMTKEREETCLASWSVVSISVGWQRERRGCVCHVESYNGRKISLVLVCPGV